MPCYSCMFVSCKLSLSDNGWLLLAFAATALTLCTAFCGLCRRVFALHLSRRQALITYHSLTILSIVLMSIAAYTFGSWEAIIAGRFINGFARGFGMSEFAMCARAAFVHFLISGKTGQWHGQPKILGGRKLLTFKQSTVFCLGHRFSKNKMTRHAINLVGAWPPLPPLGYAYEGRVECQTQFDLFELFC